MPASLLLLYRQGVTVEDSGNGELRLSGPNSRVTLRQLAPLVHSSLLQMAPQGCDEDELTDQILEAGGPAALAGWYHRLNDLSRRGFLCRTVCVDGRRLLTLLPVSPAFAFLPLNPVPDKPFQLSRFAYLRREGLHFVLESPLAHARLVLDEPRLAGLIAGCAEPTRLEKLASGTTDIPSDAIPVLLRVLAAAGMIHAIRPEATDAESEPHSLRTWEFHDLLFHARIRQGRSDALYGATYRFLGELDPPAPLKPAWNGDRVDLVRPEVGKSGATERGFAEIMANRRSIRDYGSRPISVEQLGEFLYRVARVTAEREVEVETPRGGLWMEFASRPYPAGGALYELEFYAAIQSCAGLDPGLYHYDPLRHRLDRLCEKTEEVGRLLSDAAASAGIPAESAQVVLILTSRFQRIAWKYASIAYALTLKHVGVVYQTMYLTATAMNLAPCGLGGGDADLFARAAKTDYYAETSVGEFLLGSAP